jgi:hypothetical protein
MEEQMDWHMVGLGCAGGAIPDILRLIKGRYNLEIPRYWRTANFSIGFALLVVLGGLAAWLGGASRIAEALAFGFGAPEFITRSLALPEPTTKGPRVITLGEMRRFWAF